MRRVVFLLLFFACAMPGFAAINDADIFLDFENPGDLDQNNGSVSTTWTIGTQTHETTDAIYGVYSIDTDGINDDWDTTDVSFGDGASDSFTYCLWFQHDTLPSTTWIPVQGVDAGNDNWDVRFLHSTNTWSINARTSTGTGTWVDVDDTNLHSFCAVLDNSDNTFQFWFDGVNEANGTFSSYDVIDQLFLFNDKNGDQQGDTVLDLIGVWAYAFTPAQVAEYYNSGTPWNPYEPVAPSVPFAHVKTSDIADASNIEGLTVTLADGTSNTTDSNGVAYFYNKSGQGFNVTDSNSLYFTFTGGTATENTTTVQNMTGAFITLEAFDVLGQQITGFNVTSSTQTNETLTTNTMLYLVPNDTTELTFSKSGWYDSLVNITTTGQDVSTYNTSGMYDSIFVLNATDAVSGSGISSFTINTTEDSVPFSASGSTSSGEFNVTLVQGLDYNFFIDSTGYAFANVTRASNASVQYYEFSLLPQNSVFAFFFDETTLVSITSNVTVEYTNGSVSSENSSTSGDLLIQDLFPGTWTLTASTAGYDDREYIVTVTSRSTQTLNMYLLNSSAGEETTFTIKDSDTADIIPGATITMQQKIAGNWVTIDQEISDAFGIGVFALVDGAEYQFIIEAAGYTTKTGVFTRTESSYIVPLNEDNTQNFLSYLDDFTYVLFPSGVDAGPTNFGITTSSPQGRLEWFSVSVVLNSTTTTSNVTGSPSGGTATQGMDLTNFSGFSVMAVYRVKSVNFDDPLVVSRTFYLLNHTEGNYTFGGFMDYYADDDNGLSFASRGILLTIIAVILAIAAGAFFGFEAGVLIASVVFIAGSAFGWMNWGITIVVVTASIGLIIARGGTR